MPQMLVHILSRKRVISFARYVAQMHIFLLSGITKSWLFSIMSMDGYMAICLPLQYNVMMSHWLWDLMVDICAAYGVWWSVLYLLCHVTALLWP